MESTPKRSPLDNLRPPWKKGESGNLKGRGKGTLDYATIRKRAFERIGKAQNMTPEEIEEIMVQSGLTKALKGDYRFYQDDMNRTYGKPKERLDLTSAGKELGTVDAVIQAISSAKKRG